MIRDIRASGMKQVGDTGMQSQQTEEVHSGFRYGIVVGFNGSPSSERALAYAIGMAVRQECSLIIVYVANSALENFRAGYDFISVDQMAEHVVEDLGLGLARTEPLTSIPWVLLTRSGDVCRRLEQVGKDYSAEAIVVGAPRRTAGRVFRSVARGLSRRALRPLIVIP